MMYRRPRFLSGGDQALFVELGDAIDPAINRRVRNLALAIQKEKVPGVTETVPAYCSLLVYFNPQQTNFRTLQAAINELIEHLAEFDLPAPRLVEIPTSYGGEYGPDLDFVAAHNGLTTEQVVQIHTGTPYLIYMIGFMPGFPYLGGVSPRIAAPRLDTPRSRVPPGSVGIAGNQTGIYPLAGPGGWRIVGRTPLKLFDPRREPPALFQAGDCVAFVSIAPDEFDRIEREVAEGTYRVKERPIKSNGDL